MEILDQMLADVKGLYEKTTGTPYAREQLRGRRLAMPEGAEPEGYLYQQISHLRSLLASRTSPFWAAPPHWQPVLDAFDTERELVLRVELPGMVREEVSLSIGENLVVVKGDRCFRATGKNVSVLARERYYGPFERWIPLPCKVSPEKVEACFKEGVLEIRMEKEATTLEGTHRVEIH